MARLGEEWEKERKEDGKGKGVMRGESHPHCVQSRWVLCLASGFWGENPGQDFPRRSGNDGEGTEYLVSCAKMGGRDGYQEQPERE
jgi:hypothetical protein